MTARRIILLASFFAMTAVMLGAFGAHGLKAHLDTGRLATFDTGVRYQFMHAIGLFIIGLVMQHNPAKLLSRAAGVMSVGILLFSGSLYFLSCRALLGVESWTWLGAITPLGGVCFILSWAFIGLAHMRD